MTETTYEVIKEMVEGKKKMTKQDKKWFTQKIKEERAHQIKMAIFDVFKYDKDMKYFVGAATGAATALAGTILEDLITEFETIAADVRPPGAPYGPLPPPGFVTDSTGTHKPEAQSILPDPEINWMWLLSGGMGGLAGLAATSAGGPLYELRQAGGIITNPGTGLEGNIASILQIGGTGFAGSCMMVLILKSIFSGTDLGELLSGVGEIIPL